MEPKRTAYNQSRALWAITRASFKAIFANPSALIFSILFPIIFVLIFGAFGSGSGVQYRVAISPESDTNSAFFHYLKASHMIRVVEYPDQESVRKDLIKGKLAGVLTIRDTKDSSGIPATIVDVNTTSASADAINGLEQALDYLRLKMNANRTGTEAITIN